MEVVYEFYWRSDEGLWPWKNDNTRPAGLIVL